MMKMEQTTSSEWASKEREINWELTKIWKIA